MNNKKGEAETAGGENKEGVEELVGTSPQRMGGGMQQNKEGIQKTGEEIEGEDGEGKKEGNKGGYIHAGTQTPAGAGQASDASHT